MATTTAMMRGQLPLTRARRALSISSRLQPSYVCRQCRAIQISASTATDPSASSDAFGPSRDSADARFEVLGSTSSLLSVTLSASQNLYTRRGTLVSVAGKADNAQSTLSILSPLKRAFLGIPFLYQRISSTLPITALIASKSPTTTFTILHLDGTTDWQVAQRNALLAWTGHTLAVSPKIQRGLSVAHWGSTHLMGRGLAALSSPGQIYQLTLAQDEELVLHPAHVIAYSINKNLPLPYRLKSTSLRLQVPSLPAYIGNTLGNVVPTRVSRFLGAMRGSDSYKGLARLLYSLRIAAWRSIWGDRLFLQFKGPTTILMSSRGVRVGDVLTKEQVSEIAAADPGAVTAGVEVATNPKPASILQSKDATSKPPIMHIASVGKQGKVTFEDAKGLKEFVR